MSSLTTLLKNVPKHKDETKCRIFTFRFLQERDGFLIGNEISEILSDEKTQLISLTQTQSNSDSDAFVTITLLYRKYHLEK